MYNTAFGLGIALICMVAHLLLSTAMKRTVSDLETFSMRFENLIADGQGGAGASSAAGKAPAAPINPEDLA